MSKISNLFNEDYDIREEALTELEEQAELFGNNLLDSDKRMFVDRILNALDCYFVCELKIN